MRCRFEKLCEFAVEHAFFAGAPVDFLTWEPTAPCVALLARFRLLWRSVDNGGVIFYEVADTPGAGPLIPLPLDLQFTFAARLVGQEGAATTEPPFDAGRPLALGNAHGALDGATRLLHAGGSAAASDQARLTKSRVGLRYLTASATPLLEIRDAQANLVYAARPAAAAGSVETQVDLTPLAPGSFSVSLDGVAVERLYVDDALVATKPAMIVTLAARTSTAGLEFLDPAGQPLDNGVPFVARLAARAAIWRVIVVPRTEADLDETRLTVEDTVLIGAAPRFQFAATGPKAPLPNGTPAIIFESMTPITLRSEPYRGVALKKRQDPAALFVTAIADLPNPATVALSLASTPARPVSEVFVYV